MPALCPSFLDLCRLFSSLYYLPIHGCNPDGHVSWVFILWGLTSPYVSFSIWVLPLLALVFGSSLAADNAMSSWGSLNCFQFPCFEQDCCTLSCLCSYECKFCRSRITGLVMPRASSFNFSCWQNSVPEWFLAVLRLLPMDNLHYSMI